MSINLEAHENRNLQKEEMRLRFSVIQSYHTILKSKVLVKEISTTLQNILFIQTKNTRTKIPVNIVHESHVFLFYGNGQAVQNHKNKT